eukprot:jgi/Tetstr1/447624/TSEL_034985.t1
MDLLREGVGPHLHDDDLRRSQLISAARGLFNTSWQRKPPPGTDPSAPGPHQPEPRPVGSQGLRLYCIGDHKTNQHPADKPITQPCPVTLTH